MTTPIISTGLDRSLSCACVTPVNEPADVGHRLFRLRTLVVVFMAESLALALLQMPLNLDFTTFAVMDQGANLKVQTMLDRGLIPTVDFGYQYGRSRY